MSADPSTSWEPGLAWRQVQDLQVRSDNPRTHSKRQIQKLVTSIREYGFTAPLLIDERDVVLAGHGRLQAAKAMGMAKVPCRVLADLTEEKKRAYLLADNKLGLESGWDYEALAVSLEQLVAVDLDMTLTGFDLPEIDHLLTRQETESTRPSRSTVDEVPELDDVAVTCTDDIWVLGRHRLVCGDARDPGTLDRLMVGQAADLIFTDPPYNVPINGHVSGLGKTKHAEFQMASGEMSDTQFAAFLKATLALGAEHCRDGAIAFVCMDWRHIADLISVGGQVFQELKNVCVWAKTNAGMGTFYRSKHELVAVFKVGSAPHTNTFGLGDKGRYRTNVWSYPRVSSFPASQSEDVSSHPTPKPVALVADAIRDVSHRGETVLDMFAGSGTTLMAAQSTGRCARLVEIDPTYCDVIIRRWQLHTGKEAILEQGGSTFENVATSRKNGGWR